MTEYGRGPGSQSWHPDDPLYGNQQEWDDGQYSGYQNGWAPSPQQDGGYPGPPGQYGYPDGQGTGQHQQYPPQQYVPPHQQQHYEQQPYQQQPYQQYAGQQPQQQYQQPVQQQYGGWEGTQGGGQVYDPSYGAVGTDPYGMPPVDPYGTGEQPDYYAAQGGYPPPQPQHLRQRPGHEQQGWHQGQQAPYQDPQHGRGPEAWREDADPDTGWDPGPDQGEHAFFSERDEDGPGFDEDDDPASGGRRGTSTRRGSGKPRRSGCACLVVSAVLVGGVGTVGYFGYDFYQSHFAPAPDFSGDGKGEVQVEIPDGATIADMGAALKREGVVKSGGAFVEAVKDNKKAQGIEAGTYTLRKEMSGASAVDMMLDPASQNRLIIAEGRRATEIYANIDKKLGADKGTTEKAAKSGGLGLPKWAEGKPEGFLFPSRYSVGKNTEPKDVLKQMVRRAEAEYTRTGLVEKAKKADKTPREVLTIASLIEAEAQEDHEFGKVSRVIYNRLDEDMHLGFDSTINYAKGRSTLNTSVQDTRYPSPYNTYLHRGLPPGPISNPGHQAIEAALGPTKGNWLYFVTVKPGDTRFTDSKAEHDQNVRDFNNEQNK